MKKTSKKLLSFLLAFGMILSMFAVTSATGWAADEHVPVSATLVAYPKPATESLASLSSKVSRLKSSNKAVVTVKLSKSTYEMCIRDRLECMHSTEHPKTERKSSAHGQT